MEYLAAVKKLWPLRLLCSVDRFVLALGLTIVAATLAPCRGRSAAIFHVAGMAAISSLFFLQGARLARNAVVNGITHWRLHALIGITTFLLFPLLGLLLWTLQAALLPTLLWMGVMFACTLPSTVQSSIALTSIASGNVAGAVCAATLSNIIGIGLTPVLFGAIAHMQQQGGVDPVGVLWVLLQLLVPFVAGHALRPWIGAWAERNRKLLAVTDRGSILLVAYTAFSAAVVHGVWQMVPATMVISLLLVTGALLTMSLGAILLGAKSLRFRHEDLVASLFCGSQKSLVSGVPIANVLFRPDAVGAILLPIMIYYPLQLIVCGVLAKRFSRLGSVPVAADDPQLPTAAALLIDDVSTEAPLAATD